METTENYFKMPTVLNVGEMNVSSPARLSALIQHMAWRMHQQHCTPSAAFPHGCRHRQHDLLHYSLLCTKQQLLPMTDKEQKKEKQHPRGSSMRQVKSVMCCPENGFLQRIPEWDGRDLPPFATGRDTFHCYGLFVDQQ